MKVMATSSITGSDKVKTLLMDQEGIRRYLPLSDWTILEDENLDFILLPLLIYLISVGITWMLAVILGISLFICESTVHKLALKFLARTVSFNISFSDYLITGLKKLPFIVAGTLVCLSLTTCGAIALCLGTVFYFMKLTQMSQDCIEGLMWMILRNFAKQCKAVFVKKGATNEAVENQSLLSIDAATTPAITVDETTSLEPSVSEMMKKSQLKKLKQPSGESEHSTSSPEKTPSEKSDKDDFEYLQKDEAGKAEESCKEEDNLNKVSDEPDLKLVLRKTDAQKEEKEPKCENLVGTSKNERENLTHEKTKKKSEDQQSETIQLQNSLFFHATIFMIWFIVTLINLPFVHTWAHNFKYNPMLQPDPSFIPGIILSACAFPLWQMELPKIHRFWLEEVKNLLIIIAVISLVYAPISMFRLSYFLPIAVVLIILQQLLGPYYGSEPIGPEENCDDNVENEESEDFREGYSRKCGKSDDAEELAYEEHIDEKYDEIKTKLE